MEAAAAIKDAMVQNGFERIEADRLVRPMTQQPLLGPGSLFHQATAIISAPPTLDVLPASVRNRVRFDTTTRQLTVTGSLNGIEVQAIRSLCSNPTDREQIETVIQVLAEATPATTAAPLPRQFAIPGLSVRVDGQLQLLEASNVELDWDPRLLDAVLAETDYPSTARGTETGELDISESGRVEISFADRLQLQLSLLIPEAGWTQPKLCGWIDRQLLPHDDLTYNEALQYIARVIEQLIQSRGIDLETLAKDKFRLCEAIRLKLEMQRRALRQDGFNAVLFPTGGRANIEVAIEMPLELDEDLYSPAWYYDGGYRWQKHAFNVVGELENQGEEFDCAVHIDQSASVSYWVRNVPKKYGSFWLPTATDRFYPDFIARLKDGRYLALEYKNARDWSNDDSKEKRKIGELWEEYSGGKCLFLMPRGPEWAVVDAKIGAV